MIPSQKRVRTAQRLNSVAVGKAHGPLINKNLTLKGSNNHA
jgi:hypothetical protein